jgi:uncharacterized membrane protein (DUF485 family)
MTVLTFDNDKPQEKECPELTVDELIRDQLQGKSRALGRYDAIVWKIRSGYVVVLYGLLTVLTGKEVQLKRILGGAAEVPIFALMAWGISLSALLIDISFILAKVRVVEARNRLSDLALDIARGKKDRTEGAHEMQELLHLSGEMPTLPKWSLLLNATWAILILYLVSPLVITIVQFTYGP